MRQVIVRNLSRPAAPQITAGYCHSFLCQLRGLTFRRSLEPGQGLLLVGNRDSRLDSSIHMLFMWMDLAIIWVNSAGQVVDTRLARRWQPALFSHQPARYVLELHPAHLGDFTIGDRLDLISSAS